MKSNNINKFTENPDLLLFEKEGNLYDNYHLDIKSSKVDDIDKEFTLNTQFENPPKLKYKKITKQIGSINNLIDIAFEKFDEPSNNAASYFEKNYIQNINFNIDELLPKSNLKFYNNIQEILVDNINNIFDKYDDDLNFLYLATPGTTSKNSRIKKYVFDSTSSVKNPQDWKRSDTEIVCKALKSWINREKDGILDSEKIAFCNEIKTLIDKLM